MTAPSPFCASNPKLQQAWDATSLRVLMECPRKYEYQILRGFKGSKIDLEFGILYHEGVEAFTRERLSGASHADATIAAVKDVMTKSGTYVQCGHEDESVSLDWKPWGGTYEDQWRCKGTEKYKNAKGNAAKCPWSHKGKWFMEPSPSVCGECGSATETASRWIPTNPTKDRFTALRLVAWYCFDQPEDFTKGLVPYKFPDGNPAVEVSFRLPLPHLTPKDGAYILCGHLDKIVSYDKDYFVSDHKTTKQTLSKVFWTKYNPDVQMDTYDLAGATMFPGLGVKGLIVEGAQTMVGGARYGMQIYYRTDAQREEYLNDLRFWLDRAEEYAENDRWPMNRSHCWLCDFRGVCSKDPDQRERYLEADFIVEHWNPLEER